jgi:hypothetical protein
VSSLWVLPGDLFLVQAKLMGPAIRLVESFWAKDGEAKYSHAGLIVNPDGTTLEALETVRNQNIFDDYAGREIFIGRHTLMTPILFEAGMKFIEKKKGDIYPVWRLFLHLIKPLARYISIGGFTACSELNMMFYYGCGLYDRWKGMNPDDIHDMVRDEKYWTIVYEGKVPEKGEV